MNLTSCKNKNMGKMIISGCTIIWIDYTSSVKYTQRTNKAAENPNLYSVVYNLIVPSLNWYYFESTIRIIIQISSFDNVVRNHLGELRRMEEQIKSLQGSKQINPDKGHSREQMTVLAISLKLTKH